MTTPNPNEENEKNEENDGWRTLGSDADSLKAAMRHFPSGVAVITSGNGESTEAMTANAIISVSLDPPLMLASVHKDARINERIKETGTFTVNILAEDQEGHSRLFASPERSSGMAAVHSLGDDGSGESPPLASGSLAAVECALEATYPGGDHDLFLGRVRAVHLGETLKNPLLYHEGEYPRLEKRESSTENRAFMDSARGYDARLRGFSRKKKRR